MDRLNKLFNLKEFHKSTTDELDIIKDRVRNLIGHSNWAEEGRYKESILRNVIKRFIPKSLIIGTGFIVKSSNKEYECSKQIDIIIFDSSHPILFNEGDFYIVTPNSVKAIIEVKTNIENQDLTKTIKNINEVGQFLSTNGSQRSIFNGIFSFEGYNNSRSLEEQIKQKIKDGDYHKYHVNHISLNKDIFIKYWPSKIFSVYKIKNLSFSFFISNLMYHIVDTPINNENELWFPIDKEKEKLFDISLGGQNDR